MALFDTAIVINRANEADKELLLRQMIQSTLDVSNFKIASNFF